ncbi:hypothetical protein SEUCBS139899_004693 [Sporothrix eucalyptigena]|uniref:Uncharacterized protein n=1 Tax=Sporothrix eucalyptigena TaxID=1812306 RepID=A0ABP0D386_9PEZI
MHTLSSSMPRLFGRSQAPTTTQGHGQQPTELHTQAPRAKLVRRTGDHFSPLPGHSGHPGQAGPPASTELLHREGSIVSASTSAYEMLLNGPDRSSLCGSSIHGGSQHHRQPQQHRYYAVRSQRNLHRSWLAAADARRPSGERPPPRKLVKDPGGSARPAAAREIPDDDNGGDLRRKAAGSSGHAAGGSENGYDKNSSGLPGTLGIRRKISRWRDLRW